MSLKINFTQIDGDGNLPSGAVTGVDSAAITDGEVAAADLASDAVTTAKIADGNVTTDKIANADVTTAKIADANVTNAKMKKPCLRVYQEAIAVGDFTDGEGATGTLDLSTSIPAGAYFVKTLIHGITGFAGDTSATIQVGDGTDVDRYNTGTPDVFSTAAAGVDMGAVSGTAFHAAAKTPKVTITTDSDFTAAVTNGSGAATITLYYYEPV
jgi:hypothetical protein